MTATTNREESRDEYRRIEYRHSASLRRLTHPGITLQGPPCTS